VKKLLLILVVLAMIWVGARYVLHRGEVRATVVMNSAGTLHKGDPVVENGVEVGRVTKIASLDGSDAVSVRLDRKHPRAIVSDSLFAVDGRQLVVNNAFAMGAPVADGDVIKARDSRVAQWLARHGDKIAPLMAKVKSATDEKLDALDAEHLDTQLDAWTSRVPDWKKEGTAAFEKRIDEIKAKVSKIEDDLRRSNRAADARAVKEKVDRWIEDIRK
jgi:hypothetical protein